MRPFQAILTASGMTLLFAVLAVLVSPGLARERRCFPEATDYCIQGRIHEFWEQHGGLPIFGYPIGPQREERVEGTPYQVQWFERTRLELHPENTPPYDVLMGRLGADSLASQGGSQQPSVAESPRENCRYFAETGKNICGEFLRAWQADGLEIDGEPGKRAFENLALFGVPLTGVRTETLNDGRRYEVQWFERARFELHPEKAPPYRVLFGLLGREVYATLLAVSARTPAPDGRYLTAVAARETYEPIRISILPDDDDDDDDDDDPPGPVIWPTPPTDTPTPSPTQTMTPTDTMPPIFTFATTPEATAEITTVTSTPTSTVPSSPVSTVTSSPTATITSSPLLPYPPYSNETATAMPLLSATISIVPTPSPAPTRTPMASPSPSPAPMRMPTASPSPSPAPTRTPTANPRSSPTPTPTVPS